MSRSADGHELRRLAFGRDQFEEVVGVPLTSANALVSEGLIRSFKIGRRRLFLYEDVERLLKRLADRGEKLEPRRLRDARLKGESQPAARRPAVRRRP